jgi:hypothetical protein
MVKYIPSLISGIGLNNPSISGTFVHLLIHLSHLLHEQHVALVKGIVISVDMIFMPI